MKNHLLLLSAVTAFLFSCSNQSTVAEKEPKNASAQTVDSTQKVEEPTNKTKASAAEIMARKQVPVLCYHHIYATLPPKTTGYDVTISAFKQQMKALADSGYKTISPEQYYNYLVYGSPLPAKPVMLTYDDTDEEQFSIAKPEMDKYGFKGVYFIMTISINRPRYMTKEQIKQLSDEGHTIASHTWDHSRTDRYTFQHEIKEGGRKKIVNDWDQQLVKPKAKLEELIGKPIEYFAYPFGVWNKEGIPEIEKRGFKMAFQLATKRDSLQPLYTTRRIIVAPQWSAQGLLKAMETSFR
ncbi:MAG: polysaccharide deacetylase family protein [Flavisolibacter sp.]